MGPAGARSSSASKNSFNYYEGVGICALSSNIRTISQWKKQYEEGAFKALEDNKRGRKKKENKDVLMS